MIVTSTLCLIAKGEAIVAQSIAAAAFAPPQRAVPGEPALGTALINRRA